VPVNAGDVVTADLTARLMGNDYVWSWSTAVLERGDPARRKAAFSQSTFLGAPISRANLHKRAATYTPTLGKEGQLARFVLDAIASGASLGEIASQVHAKFPGHFPRWETALAYVGELSLQYG
jgi:hypothetical protein